MWCIDLCFYIWLFSPCLRFVIISLWSESLSLILCAVEQREREKERDCLRVCSLELVSDTADGSPIQLPTKKQALFLFVFWMWPSCFYYPCTECISYICYYSVLIWIVLCCPEFRLKSWWIDVTLVRWILDRLPFRSCHNSFIAHRKKERVSALKTKIKNNFKTWPQSLFSAHIPFLLWKKKTFEERKKS